MLVNADFSRRAIVAPHEYRWVTSPQGGVERVMLDRVGAEKARATSIVRYAPGSDYPRHQHPGGEEILVLTGVFSDENEDYPAGCYLRNPPGSSHQPSSTEGAVIFVKLWQMQSHEQRPVRIDTLSPSAWRLRGNREVCALFTDDAEDVSLQRLVAGEALFAGPLDGAELLVLAGGLVVDGQPLDAGGWMRLPAGIYRDISAGAHGATVYLKAGRPAGVAAQR